MKSGLESPRKAKIDVTRLLREMRLEEALRSLKRARRKVDSAAVAEMISEYESRAGQLHAAGEPGEARRLARRAAALKGLLLHGPDPARMVAEAELPEDYVGKVLMARITGGGFMDTVILRSGDEWHREILQNTRAEIADLGFPGAEVHPLGGAYAGFEPDGSIVIWGTSDEYGCCNKELAARLIAQAYPGKTVMIND